MIKYFKLKIIVAISLVLALASCTKDFETINTDQNNPTSVPSTNILAYVLYDFTGGSSSFFDLWINGNESSYANQLGKIQYVDESRYAFRESTINSAFATVYRDLQNLKQIEKQADANGDTNMKAAAMTYSAFIWQIATDTWRDIPFTDAINAEDGAISPTYDTQEEIYPAVMQILEDANDLFNEGATDELGSGDLLFNGDVSLWQKFANSIRLRMAIRISNVDPTTSKQVIEEILGNPTKYPVIASNDENAFFNWVGSSPYYEPFYKDHYISDRDDHGVCSVLIDQLKAFNDPRLPVYAKPATNDSIKYGLIVYRGVIAGVAQSTFDTKDISRIGARFRDNAAGFSPYMRYAEVLFIKAEAAQRGWSVGMTAKDAYTAAVTASLEENEISASDIATYLAQSTVAYNNTLDQIYLQKWISLFKQGHEAWAETRRTDVPKLGVAPSSAYSGHNRPPFREPYPTNEYSLNLDNISPYWDKVTDRLWGQQMWWDTRTGVK
jgi:hypothetical protein